MAQQRFVYFIASEACGTVKIGKSDNIRRRLEDIRSMSPDKCVYLLGFIACKNFNEANYLEGHLHRIFKKYHSHREWFLLTERSRKALELLVFTMPEEWYDEVEYKNKKEAAVWCAKHYIPNIDDVDIEEVSDVD